MPNKRICQLQNFLFIAKLSCFQICTLPGCLFLNTASDLHSPPFLNIIPVILLLPLFCGKSPHQGHVM